MRNRLIEISAAVAGIAIVIGIYVYRTGGSDVEPTSAPEPVRETLVTEQPLPPDQAPPKGSEAVAQPITPAVAEPVDSAEIEEAQTDWETAVANVAAVKAELQVLDERFDAKEAELAEMESEGMDPDLLEEEMLIFLDGIVDEYDEMESRLADAEALESAAAERLTKIQGSLPDPR